MNDYNKSLAGIRPEGCTCILERTALFYGYNGPEPAEWSQNPWCKVHPYHELTPCIRCGKLWPVDFV